MGRNFPLVNFSFIMKTMFKKNNYGFTLIEALVVIFIMSLMSTLILANYQSNKKKYTLLQMNQKLISDFRKVQNMAISGTEIAGLCSISSACYGYGIYFNSNSSYILFADINNNQLYDDDIGEEFETVNLLFPIVIQSVSPLQASVVFRPPEPITYINGNSGVGASAEIILQIQGTTLTKKIGVNTAGLIENK